MVKYTQKLKLDPTLALEILEKIKQSAFYDVLLNPYQNETQQLLRQLDDLGKTDEANTISIILLYLNEYYLACKNFESVPENLQKPIQSFFDGMTDDLHIDGYTLNRTNSLIAMLQTFIQEADTLPNIKEALLLEESSTVSLFHKTKRDYHAIKQGLNVANNLKRTCEEIRSQIGSPETQPKGLLIDFMFHLCEAIRFCQSGLTSTDINKKLIQSIKNEIDQIHQQYPELAKVAEELQNAIANCQMQKQ